MSQHDGPCEFTKTRGGRRICRACNRARVIAYRDRVARKLPPPRKAFRTVPAGKRWVYEAWWWAWDSGVLVDHVPTTREPPWDLEVRLGEHTAHFQGRRAGCVSVAVLLNDGRSGFISGSEKESPQDMLKKAIEKAVG